MSTVNRERSVGVPPLVAGERLDRATFHERYEAMPPETRAELIGGVVVMASPVGLGHGEISESLLGWLFSYRCGLGEGADNATVELDDLAESQPDALLRIRPEFGGQARVERGYLVGAPELVVEVAHSSKSTDLGPKFADYERAGVLEYLVVTLDPDAVHWFARRGDRLAPLAPGGDGVFRSEVFPGLWLDPAALFADDLEGLLAALGRGRAAPGYAAFAARMGGRRPG